MTRKRSAVPDERRLLSHLVATRPRRERRSAVAAAVGSLGFHGAIVAGLIWLTISAARPAQPAKEDQLLLYTPPPEAPPPPVTAPTPPPPPRVVNPLRPVPELAPRPAVARPEPARGFQTLTPPTVTPPDIPPPSAVVPTREADFSGEGAEGGSSRGTAQAGSQHAVTADDIAAAPTFTPYTVAPELTNRDQVARALEQAYPESLREEGVGGKALIWFFIDESGRVEKSLIKQSSGRDALDRAALEVAKVMRFTPALNRDKHVPVWVALPIAFNAQEAGE